MTTLEPDTTPANTITLTDTLDLVLEALTHSLSPRSRWVLEGWAGHIRGARHQNHAANSFARHADEFGDCREAALALTVARCMDFSLTGEEARALIDERAHARASRGLALVA